MKKRRSLAAILNDLNYHPIFGIFLINEFLDQILEFHTFQISGTTGAFEIQFEKKRNRKGDASFILALCGFKGIAIVS